MRRFALFSLLCSIVTLGQLTASPLVVYLKTTSGKSYTYFTPTESGTTVVPIYRNSTAVETSYVIQDLQNKAESFIHTFIAKDRKRYFTVNLGTIDNWNTVETEGSPTVFRGTSAYPKTTKLIQYELDGFSSTVGTQRMHETYYMFGIESVAEIVGSGSHTFAPTLAGNGTQFHYREYQPISTIPIAQQDFPYAGKAVTVRNFYRALKYVSKTTGVINTGAAVVVSSFNLTPGTRGYATYKIAEGLKKAKYIQAQ